mmetsp:Transcript_22090/g.33512  ORF Transcript_22090/g.33512 Transcript_22090/m.33512 type:complete len:1094 (-) Transcript_22090:91-3372(-)
MERRKDHKYDGTIIPMEASSVKRIVAGQAITDLASAVKELIDNALDAGAKTINIRLFNQGIDIVEVSDDGCGVSQESRPYMAMKHTTSKIRSFDEIYSSDCETLGFRGEALFCLANISSSLIVSTRTENQELGEKLMFTKEGYLLHEKIEPLPRKVGTTVAVVKLFDALPVRRADLIKRIEAQRQKVFLMIQSYAIHCLGIKINLIDIPDNGPEIVRLSTMHGTSRLEQTISSVLGSRFLSGMSRISLDSPAGEGSAWRVEGLVAKAPMLTARDGSVARNAQFFCINGRPVNLPKISKAISDAWRMLEGASTEKKRKKPACVLHFCLPKNSYDVNLSPDKRQVLLVDEPRICEVVHQGVLSFWNIQQDGRFFQNELENVKSQEIEAANFSDVNSSSNSVPGRRAKRRMAFVNDFSSVKLQHDEGTSHLQGDSSQVKSNENDIDLSLNSSSIVTPSNRENCVNEKPTVHQEENNDTQRQEETSNSAASLNHSGQDASPPPDIDQPNDKERLLWSTVQQQFQQRRTSDEEQHIQSICDTSSQTKTITPANMVDNNIADAQCTSQNLQSKDENYQHKMKVLQSLKSTSADSTVDRSPEGVKRKAITMEDFGFQPIEKSSTVPSKKRKENEASTQGPTPSSVESKSQGSSSKCRNGGEKKNESKIILNSDTTNAIGRKITRKRRRLNSPDSNEKGDVDEEELENQIETPINQISESDNVSTYDDSCRKRRKEINREESESQKEELSEDESGSEEQCEKENVIWGDFLSTEDVIHSARLARLRLQDLREKTKTKKSERKMQNSESPSVENGDKEFIPKEETLSLSKCDFKDMQIIGQFNLGFILAKCRNNSLWVLDQHACDEKYNFERLLTTTAIQGQPLIAPMPIELNPREEACILDNMNVFEQNGFRFKHDPEEPMPGRRLALTSLPHSGARDGCKAVQFGKEDVRALCALLTGFEDGNDEDDDDVDYSQNGGGTGTDGSGIYGNNAVRRYASSSQLSQKLTKNSFPRLPKTIAMLANRACRNSIMIGKSLSMREMETVVHRLSDVDHPWNCPHGRPTMKHVKDMLSTTHSDVRQSIARAVGPTVATIPPMTQDDE